ncbi:MAG: hypothetical protein J6J93_03630 [Muribaculaceae bacterium]|nr:hypothetical protein [Muribaculaceae bacterium]
MSKKSIIMCILTVLLVGWLCYAIPLTWGMASQARMKKGVDIRLSDPTSKFVDARDVIVELGIDTDRLGSVLRDSFDIDALEKRLKASDKLQDANITMLSDGSLVVDVDPMVPVARVFDTTRPSYYINASGKRISAELRYHIDVPVLVGTFGSEYPAQRLLPLLSYIASDSTANAMIATVTQEPDGNIILVPNIVGHVINFGDTSRVADKFARLRTFYRHVAPTKGWATYDTIAVKWRDRIVATRRHKELAPIPIPTDEDQTGILDLDDNEPAPEDISPEIIEDQKRTLP